MLDLTYKKPTTVRMSDDERASLAKVIDKLGIRQACASFGVCRQTMERAAGGLTIYRGTAFLIPSGIGQQQSFPHEEIAMKT
jgi:hypothetical protein